MSTPWQPERPDNSRDTNDAPRYSGYGEQDAAPDGDQQYAAPQSEQPYAAPYAGAPYSGAQGHGQQLYAAQPYGNSPYGNSAYGNQPYGDQQYATQSYGGQYPTYGQPQGPRSPRMGNIALILALVALVASTIASVFFGMEVGRSLAAEAGNAVSDTTTLSEDVPMGAIVSMFSQVLWTVLGITALVLGIMATVQNRGRGKGIAAIVIAVLAPLVSFIVYIVVLGVSGGAGL